MAQEKRQTLGGSKKASQSKLRQKADADKTVTPPPPASPSKQNNKQSALAPRSSASNSLFSATQSVATGAGLTGRRRAAPARRRIAANDDAPTIGGLIFSLQQRPSRRPFLFAAGASFVWFLLSLTMVWGVVKTSITAPEGFSSSLLSSAGLTAVATILIPMVLFWFLALLVWRAQELKMMSSTMTEVAVRLAEPDHAAEQSIASLGQSVRRQVTAMNDAISRAIGRASELEAMVHNEVAALERSYSENEHRIRNLIDELANERTALASNSERVATALQGIGGKITRDISTVGAQVAERLGSQSQNVVTNLERAGQGVVGALLESSQSAMDAMSEKGNHVTQTMTAMNERIAQDMPAVLDRLGSEQIKLDKIIQGAGQTLSIMDQALGKHTKDLDSAVNQKTQLVAQLFADNIQHLEQNIGQSAQSLESLFHNKTQNFENTLQKNMHLLDETMSRRVHDVDLAMTERTMVLDQAFNHRMEALDQALVESSHQIDHAFQARSEELNRVMETRSQNLAQTLGMKTQEIDMAISKGTEHLRAKTDDITHQVVNSIKGLISQAQQLKDVSNGIQSQIGGLSKQMEDQTNTALLAGNETSRHQQAMSQRIADQTTELEQMMKSYAQQLDITMENAGRQASSVLETLKTTTNIALQPNQSGNSLANSTTNPAINQLLDDLKTSSQPRSDVPLSFNNRPNQTSSPQFQAPLGSQHEQDIDALTHSLQTRQPLNKTANPVQNWSVGDLLARASHDDGKTTRQSTNDANTQPSLNLTQLANFVHADYAMMFWEEQAKAPNTIVPLNIYTDSGQTYLHIRKLYQDDVQFKASVASYLTDFERKLNRLGKTDQAGAQIAQTLRSESGRVYLLLMHASGRLN